MYSPAQKSVFDCIVLALGKIKPINRLVVLLNLEGFIDNSPFPETGNNRFIKAHYGAPAR
jgi:hypothetical protein